MVLAVTWLTVGIYVLLLRLAWDDLVRLCRDWREPVLQILLWPHTLVMFAREAAAKWWRS